MRFRYLLFWFFSCAFIYSGMAQQAVADRKAHALNRYTLFVNEGIHALEVLRERLEVLNRTANANLASDGKSPVSFVVSDFQQDLKFNQALVGVCKITHPGSEFEIHLRSLYEKTTEDNSLIPATSRAGLNQRRDEMMYILIELFGIADSLQAFADRKEDLQGLAQLRLYSMLQRCEVLFHDFDATRESISYLIRVQAAPMPPGLRELQQLVAASRKVVIGVRLQRWQSLQAEMDQLEAAIKTAEAAMLQHQSELEKLGLYYRKEGTGYKNVLVYAREIQKRAALFTQKKAIPAYYYNYGPDYYYYNEQLLTAFNHRKYGMLAYYNRFLQFAHVGLPLQIEEAPVFRVIMPSMGQTFDDIPSYTSSPAVGALAGNLHPLAGAPASHLVFLLDVSASMRQPGRIDLLKEGMIRMLQWLRPEDHVSIVIYAGEVNTLLPPTSAAEKERITKAIRAINFSGKTNAEKGLKQAYKVASEYLIPEGTNRILWATDGDFEVNGSMERLADKGRQQDVFLTVLQFGRRANADSPTPLYELATRHAGKFIFVQRTDIDRILLEEAAGLEPDSR